MSNIHRLDPAPLARVRTVAAVVPPAVIRHLDAGFDATETMRAALARYDARLDGTGADDWPELAGILSAQLREALTELAVTRALALEVTR